MTKQIDDSISKRIEILRFPLILGVVMIHGAISQIFSISNWKEMGLSLYTVHTLFFFSYIWGRISVPFLFLLAAYLFFHNYEQSLKGYSEKISRRWATLVIPFFIWNMVAIAGIFIFEITYPKISHYFNPSTKLLCDYTIMDWINGFIGYPDNNSLYNPPTWFLRDLFTLSLCSPIIYFLVRIIKPVVGLMIVMLFWFLVPNIGPLQSGHGIDALVFFSLGSIVYLWKVPILWIDKYGKGIGVLFMIMAGIECNLLVNGFNIWQVHRFTLLLGIMTCWYLAGMARRSQKLSKWLIWLANYAFFVYVAHMPIITKVIKGLFYEILPRNSLGILSGYILTIAIVSSILVVMGYLIKRNAPGVFKVINGGR